MSYYLGIDFGGTDIKTGVIAADGTILLARSFSTPVDLSSKRLVAYTAQAASETIAEARTLHGVSVKACGMGVPGLVDFGAQCAVRVVNATALEHTTAAEFSHAIGLPLCMDNDVNCMALAETRFGAAKGLSDVIALTIGTGIGGAIILDKQVYRGARFCAGEIGHMTVEPEGVPCTCGNCGCLERYAARDAIVRQYIEHPESPGITTECTPRHVQDFAERGDRAACSAYAAAGRYLGIALASLVNVLNPEAFVIGGGISKAGNLMLEPARHEMLKRAFPFATEIVQILPAAFGNDAGIIGAACLAMGSLADSQTAN